ncbi:MAG: tetratricopeptide repeat protein [Saprospiraceae bacterium]
MKKTLIFLAISLIFSTWLSCQNTRDNKNFEPQRVKALGTPLDTPITFENKVKEIIANENKPYDRFFDGLDGMSTTMSYSLGGISILFGIISLVLLGLQVVTTRREQKKMDEMNKFFQDSIRSQTDENNKLLKAVIENVDKTTSFIGSYQQLILIKESAEQIRKKQKLAKQKKKKELRKRQTDLNGEAMRLLEDVFSANYSSTLFSESEKDSFRLFAQKWAGLEEDIDLEVKYSNNGAYFLCGLHLFLINQPKNAAEYLLKSIEVSDRLASDFTKISAGEIADIFPQNTESYKKYEQEGWVKKVRSYAAFYLGRTHYLQGKYTESIRSFDRVLADFPNEIDAIFYKFQAIFWRDEFGSLSELQNEFTGLVNSAITHKSGEFSTAAQAMLLARLNMKLGDFCMHSNPVGDKYDRGIPDALSFYFNAYEEILGLEGAIPEGYSPIEPMVNFNFGKAIKLANEKNLPLPAKIPKGIDYLTLFDRARKLIKLIGIEIENKETLYILQYMLSKCQEELDNLGEAEKAIDEAFKAFSAYCSHHKYRGYSPIVNSMLPQDKLKSEILAHRESIIKKLDKKSIGKS